MLTLLRFNCDHHGAPNTAGIWHCRCTLSHQQDHKNLGMAGGNDVIVRCTLWWSNIKIEIPPIIDGFPGFPIKFCDVPLLCWMTWCIPIVVRVWKPCAPEEHPQMNPGFSRQLGMFATCLVGWYWPVSLQRMVEFADEDWTTGPWLVLTLSLFNLSYCCLYPYRQDDYEKSWPATGWKSRFIYLFVSLFNFGPVRFSFCFVEFYSPSAAHE